MTKFAVNIMGYVEDTTGKYNSETMDQLLELVKHAFEPIKIVAISTKELPPGHDVIDKNKVKKTTGVLSRAIESRRKK